MDTIKEKLTQIISSCTPKQETLKEVTKKLDFKALEKNQEPFFNHLAGSFIRFYEESTKSGLDKQMVAKIIIKICETAIKNTLIENVSVYLSAMKEMLDTSQERIEKINVEIGELKKEAEEVKLETDKEVKRLEKAKGSGKKEDEYMAYLRYAANTWGNEDDIMYVESLIAKIKYLPVRKKTNV